MSIPVPDLDDRNFADLVAAARDRIRQIDPGWTDLGPHDPGMVLVEAFAHLTDMLMYRVNRVPDRLYAVFLNLLGTALGPPAAATTTLELRRPGGGDPVRIPRGTRFGCPPGPPGVAQPVFTTLVDAELGPGETSTRVPAADLTLHDAVVVGVGTGRPGQSLTLPGAPLVEGRGPTVAIEVDPGSLASGAGITVGDKAYRTCREVAVFADAAPGEPVVRVDRAGGTLSFAWFADGVEGRPLVPAAGATILAWYCTGGGERGNVGTGTVTVARDALPAGLTVSNPEPATGGRAAEPLDAALRRAPQEFQARDRAVTARDYEVLAARHGAVARARARTRRDLWAFASPGEVEVVLVPRLPDGARPDGRVSLPALRSHSDPTVLEQVTISLRDRATIGARPVVRWGDYKQVGVDATVVVRPDEDVDGVRARLVRLLSRAINPLPDADDYGSGFGRPLRVSNLYRTLEQSEPGVLYVDRVRLVLDDVPDAEAVALVRAGGQPSAWFVGQRETLFRTTNDAGGWEAVARWKGETVRAVAPFPGPDDGGGAGPSNLGLLAVATESAGGSRVRVSQDLGASWRVVGEVGFDLADLAWVDRGGTPVLLLAGTRGLYELTLLPGAVPVQNLVDVAQPDLGFHAVESFRDIRGRTGVVLAAEASAGVYLSPDAGAPRSFRRVRAPGEDVRCLSVQQDGPSVVLWAGRGVAEGDGIGCVRLRVDELSRIDAAAPPTWDEFRSGWVGGSCWSVRAVGDTVYAATQSGGVARLVLGPASAAWVPPDVNGGLPLRDRRRFQPVTSLAGAEAADGSALLLAAGPAGVHRSADGAASWRTCSARAVDDVITLPDAWLFVSGEHRIEVLRADA